MTQHDLVSSIARLTEVLESVEARLAELVARSDAPAPAPEPRQVSAQPSYHSDIVEFARSSIEEASGEWVQARDAYLAYCAWACARGGQATSERSFAVVMKRLGFEKFTSATGKRERIQRYAHIRLARPDAA